MGARGLPGDEPSLCSRCSKRYCEYQRSIGWRKVVANTAPGRSKKLHKCTPRENIIFKTQFSDIPYNDTFHRRHPIHWQRFYSPVHECYEEGTPHYSRAALPKSPCCLAYNSTMELLGAPYSAAQRSRMLYHQLFCKLKNWNESNEWLRCGVKPEVLIKNERGWTLGSKVLHGLVIVHFWKINSISTVVSTGEIISIARHI
jgi:hypothetical protein